MEDSPELEIVITNFKLCSTGSFDTVHLHGACKFVVSCTGKSSARPDREKVETTDWGAQDSDSEIILFLNNHFTRGMIKPSNCSTGYNPVC